MNGEGYGIVVRTGDDTFIGKINAMASGTKATITTLQQDINRFIRIIAVIAITMAIILFACGMGRGMQFADAFVYVCLPFLLA